MDYTEDTLLNELVPDAGVSDDSVTPFGFEHDASALESRLNSAADLDVPVVPVSRALYRFPEKQYVVNLDAYTIDWGERAAGSCMDYIFNAGPDGHDCKHILYVKNLISHGYLPPASVSDVKRWMRSRLVTFRDYLTNEIEKTTSTILTNNLIAARDTVDAALATPRTASLRHIEAEVMDAVY